jgi:3-deoxy-D-manno-octulosonate 8-phosphate phosphatase (KDO 8-P phosphatase)
VRRLIDAGVVIAVISGRKSVAVEKRMAELGVRHVVQGCKDKVAAFDKIISGLDIAREECAYVGDDIPDLALLGHVGYAIAVANAVPAVHEQCDFSTSASGGFGAVREVCDLILNARVQSD